MWNTWDSEQNAFSGNVDINSLIRDNQFHHFTVVNDKQAGITVPGAPADMVLARDFTNGRVLYRTSFSGKDPNFFAAAPVVINLEQPMRILDHSGVLGQYVTQVELKGYEGLILSY